ncbi:MAG: MvaI/BcnI family restriction endonuclease [Rickettsiales bacterium]|nr:MvaI/BcnI family restriction endonuclease [Rickettsiales bacterium]
MGMDLNEIKNNLSCIKNMGYIKTHRNGPTGIGKTLEDLLQIKENNISLPDFGNIELKSTRENCNNLVTLFTFNNKAWKMNPLEAIKKYGSKDKNDRLGMYYTMGIKPNSSGLFLHVQDDDISVRHIDGSTIATWRLAEVEKQFDKKVKSVLLVKAKVEIRDNIEYFYYDRAKLLSCGTTKSILKSQFESQKLLVDLRLHDKGTMARNHGTGFRIYENNMEDLYKKVEEINI